MNEALETLRKMCDYLCEGENPPERCEVEKAVEDFCSRYESYEICKTINLIRGLFLSKTLYNVGIPKDLQNIARIQLWNLTLMTDMLNGEQIYSKLKKGLEQ